MSAYLRAVKPLLSYAMGRMKYARARSRQRGRAAVRGGRFLSLGSRVTPSKKRRLFGPATVTGSIGGIPVTPKRFPPTPMKKKSVVSARYSRNKGGSHIDYITRAHGHRMRGHNKLATKIQRSLVPIDSYTFKNTIQQNQPNSGYQMWGVLPAGTPLDVDTIMQYINQREANGQAQVAASGLVNNALSGYSGKFRIYDYESTYTMKNQSQLGLNLEIYEVIARHDLPNVNSVAQTYASILDMVQLGFARTDEIGVNPDYLDPSTSLYQNHVFCSWFKILNSKRHFMAPGYNLQLKLAHNKPKTINPLVTRLTPNSTQLLSYAGYTRAFVYRCWGEVVHQSGTVNVTTGDQFIDILGHRKYHFNAMFSLGTFDVVDGGYPHVDRSTLAFINVETGQKDTGGDDPAATNV